MYNKQTKRALLASVLSLVICAAMLVGTTFAWFTDSVTSGKNTIVAGNLDVELEYATVDTTGALTDWTSVDGATDLFADGLWEPGYAQVVYLRVSNLGTLALKYQFSLNITSETPGTNVNGAQFLLSDYLQYGVVDGQDTAFATRAEAIAAVKNPVSLDTTYGNAGKLAAEAEPQYVALVVYMPQTVGNEANYRGNDVPTIELGINLVATQDTVESDSFDNLYDQSAQALAADLENKLAAGGNVNLVTDVVVVPESAVTNGSLDPMMTVNKDTTLNLQGNTLSLDQETSQETLPFTPSLISVAQGTLTIEGNGVINAEAGYNTAYGVTVDGGTLVIDGGTYYGAMSAVQVSKGTAIINDGFFDLASTIKADAPQYSTYLINCIDGAYKNGTAKVEIRGGTFVNFDPSNNGAEGANTNFVAEGYGVISKVQENGEIWYTVVKAAQTSDELTTALNDAKPGDTVALIGNVTLSAPLTINKDITIDGLGSAAFRGKPVTVTADVTFKNLTLDKPTNSNNNATLVYAHDGCDSLTFDGCTFSDPQWEAIQITSSSFKRLTVNNCTFTAANVEGAPSNYGNTENQAIRFIHIEPDAAKRVVADITITNNVFKNCDHVVDSVVGIYYVDGSTITVGGNSFEQLGDVDGISSKLSVGWPEEEELKVVSNWTGAAKTFTING